MKVIYITYSSCKNSSKEREKTREKIKLSDS